MQTDALWFEESLQGLINNAIKFSPIAQGAQHPQTPKDCIEDSQIEVLLSVLSKKNSNELDESFLHVQVKDHGLGVPKSDRDSLFSYAHIFSRTLPACQQSGGAGLGLHVLACRCAALQGSANYFPNLVDKGTQEKGSIFSFDIPMVVVRETSSLRRASMIPSFTGVMTPLTPSPPQLCRRHSSIKCMSLKNRVLKAAPSQEVETVPEIFTMVTDYMIDKEEVGAANQLVNAHKLFLSSSTVDLDQLQQMSLANTPRVIVPCDDYFSGRSLRLLVVDDSVTIRKMAAMVLRKAGHEVTLAAHGQEAIQLLLPDHEAGIYSQPQFDVALMDIQMPVMDGVTATSIYRLVEAEQSASRHQQQQHRLLIIGMSACSDDAISAQAHDAGMDYFMPKPFSIHHFLDILHEVDGRYASN